MKNSRQVLAGLGIAALLVLTLAACSGLTEPLLVAPQPTASPITIPDNETDCLEMGGTWGPQGRAQMDMCDLPTTDAGQACGDSSQCEGMCLASDTPSVGTCSPRTVNFGCFDIMMDGVQMGICID